MIFEAIAICTYVLQWTHPAGLIQKHTQKLKEHCVCLSGLKATNISGYYEYTHTIIYPILSTCLIAMKLKIPSLESSA